MLPPAERMLLFWQLFETSEPLNDHLSWLFEVAFVQCMKDMVKVEFPSKKALSHEGPELCHLCQVKYFVVMKSERAPDDISIDAGLPIEWGAYPPPRSIL